MGSFRYILGSYSYRRLLLGLRVVSSYSIQLARGACRRLRPLFFGGRPQRHLRRQFGCIFRALVYAVLVYGSEVWALSEAQIARLESVVRACLRQALPRYERTDPRYVRNRHLLAVFDMPSVETLVLRRQAMLLGHLARMDPERLQLQMLAGRRIEPGQGAGGCRGPSLMGVFGPAGVYQGIRDVIGVRRGRHGGLTFEADGVTGGS